MKRRTRRPRPKTPRTLHQMFEALRDKLTRVENQLNEVWYDLYNLQDETEIAGANLQNRVKGKVRI